MLMSHFYKYLTLYLFNFSWIVLNKTDSWTNLHTLWLERHSLVKENALWGRFFIQFRSGVQNQLMVTSSPATTLSLAAEICIPPLSTKKRWSGRNGSRLTKKFHGTRIENSDGSIDWWRLFPSSGRHWSCAITIFQVLTKLIFAAIDMSFCRL